MSRLRDEEGLISGGDAPESVTVYVECPTATCGDRALVVPSGSFDYPYTAQCPGCRTATRFRFDDRTIVLPGNYITFERLP